MHAKDSSIMEEKSKKNIKADEKHPDRPLECSECRKRITVHYTEIVGNVFAHSGMCSDCPQLHRRLKGTNPAIEKALAEAGGTAGFVCGECQTTLENFRISNLVGCSNCYQVFGDVIVEDLMTLKKVKSSVIKRQKSAGPLHIGRSPGETQEISPSLRLIALNEALEETLQREDYEQAAWLRDQIKELTEEKDERNK